MAFIPWDPRREYRQALLAWTEARNLSHLRPEQADAMRASMLKDIAEGRRDLPRWLEPGCLVYSCFHGANVPVITASFDTGYGGSQWVVNTPGYGAPADHYSPARASAPTHHYEPAGSHCWRRRADGATASVLA